MRDPSVRRLVVVAFALDFVASCALLLSASMRSELPARGGPIDVVIALIVVGNAALTWAAAPKPATPGALSVGHAAAATVPALEIAAMWWFRESLDLNVLLPGTAWRTFIALYTLPFAIDSWRRPLR